MGRAEIPNACTLVGKTRKYVDKLFHRVKRRKGIKFMRSKGDTYGNEVFHKTQDITFHQHEI